MEPKVISLKYKQDSNGNVSMLVDNMIGVNYVWQYCKGGTAQWYDLKDTDSNTYSFTLNRISGRGDKYRCLLRNGNVVRAYSKVLTVNEEIINYREEKRTYRQQQKTYSYKRTENKKAKDRKTSEKQQQTSYNDFFKGCTTWQQIKERYRKLMQIYHPDMKSGNEEYAKAINKQYGQLKIQFNH